MNTTLPPFSLLCAIFGSVLPIRSRRERFGWSRSVARCRGSSVPVASMGDYRTVCAGERLR
jgi:hypothetical protein